MGKLLIRTATVGQAGAGNMADRSLEAHHRTMGNSIIGSRHITSTNTGPEPFNRPSHTHNSTIALRNPPDAHEQTGVFGRFLCSETTVSREWRPRQTSERFRLSWYADAFGVG